MKPSVLAVIGLGLLSGTVVASAAKIVPQLSIPLLVGWMVFCLFLLTEILWENRR